MAETGPVVIRLDAEMQEIVPRYLQNRAADCVALRDHARAATFDEARRLGHNMKGNGGGYGFVEISRLGAQIEIAATNGDAAAMLTLAEELSAYLARVQPVYGQGSSGQIGQTP